MHRQKVIFTVVLLALIVSLPRVVHAEGDVLPEAWVRAMTPGQPHADLAKIHVGKRDSITTFWEEPGAERTHQVGGSLRASPALARKADAPFLRTSPPSLSPA